jgi:hypothetical protein
MEVVASLAFAIAAATGLLSTPTEGIPFKRAAKFVVPRPQKGSKTHLCAARCSPPNTRRGNYRGYIVKYGHIALRLEPSICTVLIPSLRHIINTHQMDLLRRAIHFCHSELQTFPQSLIQPPVEVPMTKL